MFAQRSGYDTDLSDSQWAKIRKFIPRAGTRGRERETDMRSVVDAIFYIVVNGCKWRNLPKDFPPWQTVYRYFVLMRKKDKWQKIHHALYEEVREEAGKESQPSLLVMDSQSVKTGKNAAAITRGFDGGKKVKGRKRHLVADSLGLLVDIVITPANMHDTKGGMAVLKKIKDRWNDSRIKKIIADKGYRGELLRGFVQTYFNGDIEIGQNHTSPAKGFVPAEKRWVVERGFAWLGDYWRLAIDRERLIRNSVSFIRIAFIRLMLRRLCPVPSLW
ncbi:IS5 family transposase [Komagataeibacter oboediens]